MRFTGFLQNESLPDYYRLADLVCMPTLVQEAAGLVAIEAMACGRPVLATRSGGLPEYLAGSQAVLVDLNRDVPGQLAWAIEMLRDHPELRAEMGRAGAQAAKRFSVEAFYNDFVRILADRGERL